MRQHRFTTSLLPSQCIKRLEQLVQRRLFPRSMGKGIFHLDTTIVFSQLKIEKASPNVTRFRMGLWGRRFQYKIIGFIQKEGADSGVALEYQLGFLSKLAIAFVYLFPFLLFVIAWIMSLKGYTADELIRILRVALVLIPIVLGLLIWDYRVFVPVASSIIVETLTSDSGRSFEDRANSAGIPDWMEKSKNSR
jgi:hypothetical protein